MGLSHPLESPSLMDIRQVNTDGMRRPPEDFRSKKRRCRVSRSGDISAWSKRALFMLLLSLAFETTESFSSFKPCNKSSFQLSRYDESVEPCIIYDVGESSPSEQTAIVTIVQVTPSNCPNHRDGAPTAIDILNQENNGKGTAIGFNKDQYVKFRLVSIVAGNPNKDFLYVATHMNALLTMLEELKPQYILGTCSDYADIEPTIAQNYSTILMAQVGPPSFYNATKNPYLFGFHISTDEYPTPILQALRFHAVTSLGGTSTEPIRIVSRTKSEFYRSTCQAAFEQAVAMGFSNIEIHSYDPMADDNGNGVVNEDDEDFLFEIADKICPSNFTVDFHPAIFMCTLGEQNMLLNRLRQNGCRPVSLWLVTADEKWDNDNLDAVPYFQSAAQWHPSFTYSDQRFSNGVEFLHYQKAKLGYRGTYDMLVSYSIIMLFAKHIQSTYRVVDSPTFESDLSTAEGYEIFRRDILVLRTSTLFGPFSLAPNDQQNSGRGSAGTQWVIENNTAVNKCTSPMNQADASIVLPAPSSSLCEAGYFVSIPSIQTHPSLLSSSCEACPVDTFSNSTGNQTSCIPCPYGSFTDSTPGATSCIFTDDNILSRPLVSMAFIFVCIVWSLGISMFSWALRHRDSEIVKTSRNYVFCIVSGAILSSASIMTISFHAGTGASQAVASTGCQVAPFLYCIGWIMQLGSVAGLAYPISEHSRLPHVYSYVEPKSPYPLALGLSIDILILTIWTLLSPLQYSRWIVSENIELDTGLVTVDSVGFCAAEGNVSTWAFIGPLGIVHATTLLTTVVLYVRHRKKPDPFGQRRNCLFAALYSAQLLAIGAPVVVAVGSDITARYAVMCGLVFCNDLGVMSIIFFPIRARRKSSDEYQEESKLSNRQKQNMKKLRRKKQYEMESKTKRRKRMMTQHAESFSTVSFMELDPELIGKSGPMEHKAETKPEAPPNTTMKLTESSTKLAEASMQTNGKVAEELTVKKIDQYDCTLSTLDDQSLHDHSHIPIALKS